MAVVFDPQTGGFISISEAEELQKVINNKKLPLKNKLVIYPK